MSNGKSDLIRVTGLWSSDTRDGNQYLSGTLGGARILIFKNNFKKEGSNQPDYNLFITANAKREEKKPEQPSLPTEDPGPTEPFDPSDIPF